MSFARTFSAQPSLLKSHIVTVEVDISNGLQAFAVVGLPDKAVEEARDRVSAAIKNSGFESPKAQNKKIVISLAPADVKKEGPAFDVPAALAYLLAEEEIDFDPAGKLFLGELALDGTVRSVKGVLPAVRAAHSEGFTEFFVPAENAEEAALIAGATVYPLTTLTDVIRHLKEADEYAIPPQPQTPFTPTKGRHHADFHDIRGQETAKRALEIAAAGRHNIAMFGPPGTGKTLLARAFTGILPPLSFDEALEVTAIHSVAGTLDDAVISEAPFRSPHHTSSHVALVGGGANPRPGEITLAHRGVLFLDEFPEFERRVIEALRQPLEDGIVSVSRAKGSVRFPARFTLVAALNPCPCGNWGSDKLCTCNHGTRERYQRKLSGPIVDRIDLWTEVGSVSHTELATPARAEKSERVLKRVVGARERQRARFANVPHATTNSDMRVKDIENLIRLSPEVQNKFIKSAESLGLSARAYHRILKIARTIADLDKSDSVEDEHIMEALSYRPRQSV